MTKTLPPTITSYDLLKMAAVVLMIVDHLGYYIYPDSEWLRAAGRLCVPVWFFLIGYARGRDLSWPLWAGAGILVLANMAAGQSIFPVNVLGTMIVVRLVLDPVMRAATCSFETLAGITLALLFLSLPSYMLAEYGTHGILMAMFGYIVRNRPAIPGMRGGPAAVVNGFCLFNVLVFVGFQQMVFSFSTLPLLVMAGGTLLVFMGLMLFRPADFPKLYAALPEPVAGLVRLFGRRTLEIYVAHLILFKFIGVLTQPERFKVLDWTLFWAGG